MNQKRENNSIIKRIIEKLSPESKPAKLLESVIEIKPKNLEERGESLVLGVRGLGSIDRKAREFLQRLQVGAYGKDIDEELVKSFTPKHLICLLIGIITEGNGSLRKSIDSRFTTELRFHKMIFILTVYKLPPQFGFRFYRLQHGIYSNELKGDLLKLHQTQEKSDNPIIIEPPYSKKSDDSAESKKRYYTLTDEGRFLYSEAVQMLHDSYNNEEEYNLLIKLIEDLYNQGTLVLASMSKILLVQLVWNPYYSIPVFEFYHEIIKGESRENLPLLRRWLDKLGDFVVARDCTPIRTRDFSNLAPYLNNVIYPFSFYSGRIFKIPSGIHTNYFIPTSKISSHPALISYYARKIVNISDTLNDFDGFIIHQPGFCHQVAQWIKNVAPHFQAKIITEPIRSSEGRPLNAYVPEGNYIILANAIGTGNSIIEIWKELKKDVGIPLIIAFSTRGLFSPNQELGFPPIKYLLTREELTLLFSSAIERWRDRA